MPLGEVVGLFSGQCGVQLSQACWELFAVEHGISPDGTPVDDFADLKESIASSGVIFNATKKGRYVPRVTILDSEPTVVDEVRSGVYRGLFNPAGLISGYEDMANNFGRGYYGCPQNLIDAGMGSLRKETEQCDSVQAFTIFHSYGGGTGGGTTCRIAELMDSEYMKVPKIEMAIYPDHEKSCSMVEPYNAVLCSSTLDEISSISILAENDALTKICSTLLCMERPAYSHFNRLVALIYSGMTASLRYDGSLTASLPQLQTNLVPYPRLHYLEASIAPIHTTDVMLHESTTTQEMTLSCFDETNQMLIGNPKNAIVMASALMYRGDISIKDINSSIDAIKSRGILGLVDWCPTAFKVGLVGSPPTVLKQSGIGKSTKQLTALYNSTLIISPLKSNLKKYQILLAKKAFMHWFLQEGMEQGEFTECMEDVVSILQDYIYVESSLSTEAGDQRLQSEPAVPKQTFEEKKQLSESESHPISTPAVPLKSMVSMSEDKNSKTTADILPKPSSNTFIQDEDDEDED